MARMAKALQSISMPFHTFKDGVEQDLEFTKSRIKKLQKE